MLSKKSRYIVKLYRDDEWRPKLLKLMSGVTKYVNINKSDIIAIIEKNLDKKESDFRIMYKLAKLVKVTANKYNTESNIKRASYKWSFIEQYLTTKPEGILDYGGAQGDEAYAFGRQILGLPKNKVFVIDLNNFGGYTYSPRDDITFIHYDNIDSMQTKVGLITISHVLHHIKPTIYSRIIDMFDRVLSKDGLIMLYEHDCTSKNMARLIDIEHCLYDTINTKSMTYVKYIKTSYTNYLSILDWFNVFGKYFKPINIFKLNNPDNSCFIFFKRK
jgi:hypothetical protein